MLIQNERVPFIPQNAVELWRPLQLAAACSLVPISKKKSEVNNVLNITFLNYGYEWEKDHIGFKLCPGPSKRFFSIVLFFPFLKRPGTRHLGQETRTRLRDQRREREQEREKERGREGEREREREKEREKEIWRERERGREREGARERGREGETEKANHI